MINKAGKHMKSLKEREWFFSQEKIPFACTNPDPHYDIYTLGSTGQIISEITVDSGLGLDAPFTIGAIADLHFNVCNNDDRADEELSYTEKCRIWPEKLKWFAPAVKALDACEYCDAAVIIGDVLDYMSSGARDVVKREIISKHPDFMMAVGGHDYTKQMQTKIPDQLPLEERLDFIRAFWPNDIHYYSRPLGDKIVAVLLDNSQSKYLECQVDKLAADIARAREDGKIILVFQHEPMSSNNPSETCVKAVIANSGALSEVAIGTNPTIVGAHLRSEGATPEVYDLITKNADVVKAVFAGHWHSQFYSEIVASYKIEGEIVNTYIPQYVISGNPYYQSGIINRITVK